MRTHPRRSLRLRWWWRYRDAHGPFQPWTKRTTPRDVLGTTVLAPNDQPHAGNSIVEAVRGGREIEWRWARRRAELPI